MLRCFCCRRSLRAVAVGSGGPLRREKPFDVFPIARGAEDFCPPLAVNFVHINTYVCAALHMHVYRAPNISVKLSRVQKQLFL